MSNINNFVDRPMSGGSSSRVNNININNNRRRSVVPELAELAEQEAAKLANMRNNRSGSGNNNNNDDDGETDDINDDDDDELKHNLGSSKDIGDGIGGGIRRISKYQITSSRHRPVFGPAWQIAPGEEHLYNRQFLNMMYLNEEKALSSLRRVRDANFVRGFHEFAEKLKLKAGNFKVLGSKKEINAVVDMIKTTLKGSVMSAQSLVWRTSRFRGAVSVIQRWIRQRINEVRRVKHELKVKWRVRETAAREKIREEIENRARRLGGRGGGINATAISISATDSVSASSPAAMNSAKSLMNINQLLRKLELNNIDSAKSASQLGCEGGGGGVSNNNNNYRSSSAAAAARRRSAPEQRINDLLWALMSDAWMDDEVMDLAIHRCLMHRRCRYVDCFRVWKATSLSEFRKKSESMNITRTAMKLLECAMSLRFPAIQFSLDGVSVDELAYHAVAVQMREPDPRPTIPPARPFLEFMPKSIWEQEDEEECEEEEEEGEEGEDVNEQEEDEKDDQIDENNTIQQEKKKKRIHGEQRRNSSASSTGKEFNSTLDENSSANLPQQQQQQQQVEVRTIDLLLADTTNPNNPNRYKQPIQPLPSKSEVFRAEKKELTATINETLNQTFPRDSSSSSFPSPTGKKSKTKNNNNTHDDDDNDNDDQHQHSSGRKGWTHHEIAEEFQDHIPDPITSVLHLTKLPILELSRGVTPPFNFYHALLDFDPSKIYLYAFMKQAVCGRRVLLESQLHGKEPQKQCEEAIKILRTWVYLRTVRALSSEEIVMMDVTKRERYAPDGTPLPRISTKDDRASPQRRRAARLAAREMDSSNIRRSPPRAMLEKLIKPDVAASTHHLSTMVGDVDLEQEERERQKRFLKQQELVARRKKEQQDQHSNNTKNKNNNANDAEAIFNETVREFAASASGVGPSMTTMTNDDTMRIEEGYSYRKTRTQAARPYFSRFEENKWESMRKEQKQQERWKDDDGSMYSSINNKERQQQQQDFEHNNTSTSSRTKITPVPPPISPLLPKAGASASAMTSRTRNQRNNSNNNNYSNKPLLDLSESDKRIVLGVSVNHSLHQTSKSNTKTNTNKNDKEDTNPNRTSSGVDDGAVDGVVADDSNKEYYYDKDAHMLLSSEIAHKMQQDRRYVAPIRQRRMEMNNKIFLTNEKLHRAEESRLLRTMMVKSRLLLSSKNDNDDDHDDASETVDDGFSCNGDENQKNNKMNIHSNNTIMSSSAAVAARPPVSKLTTSVPASLGSSSARVRRPHSQQHHHHGHHGVVSTARKPTVVLWKPGD